MAFTKCVRMPAVEAGRSLTISVDSWCAGARFALVRETPPANHARNIPPGAASMECIQRQQVGVCPAMPLTSPPANSRAIAGYRLPIADESQRLIDPGPPVAQCRFADLQLGT